jgi:hypothetical protein
MSRTPARFTQADVSRALKAAAAIGNYALDLLKDGTMRLVPVAGPVPAFAVDSPADSAAAPAPAPRMINPL